MKTERRAVDDQLRGGSRERVESQNGRSRAVERIEIFRAGVTPELSWRRTREEC